MFVRRNDAFTLNADAAWTTGDLTRHVLVGVRARHVLLWILASLHTATSPLRELTCKFGSHSIATGRDDIPAFNPSQLKL